MNVYSYCYNEIERNGCSDCTFSATLRFDDQDRNPIRVSAYATICNHEMMTVRACDKNGKCVFGPVDVDINCEPEDCPFSDPTGLNCTSEKTISPCDI